MLKFKILQSQGNSLILSNLRGLRIKGKKRKKNYRKEGGRVTKPKNFRKKLREEGVEATNIKKEKKKTKKFIVKIIGKRRSHAWPSFPKFKTADNDKQA